MTRALKLVPNYTYDDYCTWKGRWEVHDGLAIAMSPMATPKHQRIASDLSRIFGNSLDKNTCDCQVYQPLDLVIKSNNIVQPDLLIVCQPIDKKYLDFPPDLVVEIHSPSTKLNDINIKFALYEEFGIRYYIMIDPDEETVKCYELDDNGAYQLMENMSFVFGDGCSVEADLQSVF